MRSSVVAVLAALMLALPTAASALETGVAVGPRTTENLDLPLATQGLQAGWVRLFVEWRAVEPAQGQFNQQALDDYAAKIAGYKGRGMKVLVTFVAAPPWAAENPSATGIQPPKDPATFSQALASVAAQWADQVDGWELWNEPNVPAWWGGAINAAAFARLVNAGVPAVRSADPTAHVITGGLAGGDSAFFAGALDAGMRGFDGVGFHMATPCRTSPPGEVHRDPTGRMDPSTFTSYREMYQELLARQLGAWLAATEIGVSTASSAPGSCDVGAHAGKTPAGMSEAAQAQWLADAFGCMAGDPFVKMGIWFPVQDITGDMSHWENGLGLFRDDGSPKPSADAFRNLSSGITPKPCGGVADRVAPSITVPQGPLRFIGRLAPLTIGAADGQTAVKDIIAFVDGQRIPGNSPAIPWTFDWFGSTNIGIGMHTLTFHAIDEGKNVAQGSVRIERVDPSKVSLPVTFDDLSVRSGKRRRITYSGGLQPGEAPGFHGLPNVGGRVQVQVQGQRPGGAGKASASAGRKKWVTISKYSESASRPFRRTVKVRKTRGVKKWRLRFVYPGVAPFKDVTKQTAIKVRN